MYKRTNHCVFYTWPLYLALILLLLNDHYLKHAIPGVLTGKLSDFSGVFLVVLFLRHFLPHHVKLVSITVLLLFAAWKSPYSQPVIDIFNSFSPLPIGRVVDYTDLFALAMIPLANHVFAHRDHYRLRGSLVPWLKLPTLFLTVFAITATSVMNPHHQYSIRKTAVEEQIDVNKAVAIVADVAQHFAQQCITCDPAAKTGEFRNTEIILRYNVLENNRGLAFDIAGQPAGVFFGDGSQEQMETIKRHLQNTLGTAFDNMELVIKLPSYQ